MSQRRSFSPEVVSSDKFLDLTKAARDLYYQLVMGADDDGFVGPKRIMKMLDADEKDLALLVEKEYVIQFESGVIVITDWLVNNRIRKDWYRPTLFSKEFSLLILDENSRYRVGTEPAPSRQHFGTESVSQYSIVKSSIVKNSLIDEKQKIIDDTDGIEFEKELEKYKNKYSPNLLEKFRNWALAEKNYKKQTIRFYQYLRINPKTTFDMGRRLATFQKNADDWRYEKEAKFQLNKVNEMPKEDRSRELERRDTGFSKLI